MIRGDGKSRREGFDSSTPPRPGNILAFLTGLWRYVHRELPQRRELERATVNTAGQATMAAEVFGVPTPQVDGSSVLLATEGLAPPTPVIPRPDDASFLLAAETFGA